MPYPTSVVIADDDNDMLHLCGRALRNAGFVVHLVSDGSAVVETVRRKRADVVLLDVVFPETSGLNILSELRCAKGTQDIPVLMLTGSDTVQTMSESMDRGATGYITKPLNPGHLVDIIQDHLAGDAKRSLHLGL